MKFLLFFVSFIFSFIFYIFYGLNIGKDIFGNTISNTVKLDSISGNLLIESIVFLLIGFFFIFLFTDNKNISNNNTYINKKTIFYFIYYIVFIFSLYLVKFKLDIILLLSVIFFILSDFFFTFLFNINNNIKFRYIGLILNYFSTGLSIYYILNKDINLIAVLILLFNIIFNFLIHRKYTNYISLSISLLSIGFLFYILYFYLFELYILYI